MALKDVIEVIEELIHKVSQAPSGQDIASLLQSWQVQHQTLLNIEKHFSRKENILFPYLEKNGITGPPAVMWALHDDIRAELKKISQLIHEANSLADKRLTHDITDFVIPTLNTIQELFYKEENI